MQRQLFFICDITLATKMLKAYPSGYSILELYREAPLMCVIVFWSKEVKVWLNTVFFCGLSLDCSEWKHSVILNIFIENLITFEWILIIMQVIFLFLHIWQNYNCLYFTPWLVRAWAWAIVPWARAWLVQ